MNDIKHLVTERHELEHRDFSILKAVSGKLEP